MGQQLWSLLGRGPRTSCQRCHSVTDAQIHPLDERGVESSRETQSLQGCFEFYLCPQAHHVRDANQLALPIGFLHLAVDQLRCHLPLTPFPTHLEPLSKMGCQGIKVHV